MSPHDILGLVAIICFVAALFDARVLPLGLIFLTLALLFLK